jgi:hypothetical protein
MASVRKALSYVFAILLLLTAATVIAQKPFPSHIAMPPINCLDVKLPVTFSWVNYDYPSADVPPIVAEKVKSIVIDFYFENGGDSEEISKAKDGYFNTFRMPFSNLQLFVVILKTPLSYSHCKLFLYDSAKNNVSKNAVDYNTWAMYNIEENSMKRSDLFKELHVESDDMVMLQKKPVNLLVRRLKHNGTDNELEETTYRANGLSLDTVSFKSKILEDPEDK